MPSDARGSEPLFEFPRSRPRTNAVCLEPPLRRWRRSSIEIDRSEGENNTVIRDVEQRRSCSESWGPSTCACPYLPRSSTRPSPLANTLPFPSPSRCHARREQPITPCARYLRAALTFFSRGMRTSCGKRENSRRDRPRPSVSRRSFIAAILKREIVQILFTLVEINRLFHVPALAMIFFFKLMAYNSIKTHPVLGMNCIIIRILSLIYSAG